MSFEDLFGNILCKRMALIPNTNRGERKLEELCKLVARQPGAGVLFRNGASNFPFIDCATGVTVWYYATSPDPRKEGSRHRMQGCVAFFTGQGEVYARGFSRDSIQKILECDPPTVIIVTNCDIRVVQDPEVDLSLIDVTVGRQIMSLLLVTAEELMNGMDCTKKLLEEWKWQRILWESV
eukprot:GFKZ01009273.1.p1 GENE.GFKZ01009273.1~~GFKZ01009273.1.p1  ORF type:complete len:180 (-),score=14.15 GFKZ01009273.1:364-903(-)